MHRQASVGEAEELAEGVDAGEHVDVVTVRVDAAQLDQRVVERHRLRVELLLIGHGPGFQLGRQRFIEAPCLGELGSPAMASGARLVCP